MIQLLADESGIFVEVSGITMSIETYCDLYDNPRVKGLYTTQGACAYQRIQDFYNGKKVQTDNNMTISRTYNAQQSAD